ncbi:MAG: peptidoglycan-binding protein, partial [bacterium]
SFLSIAFLMVVLYRPMAHRINTIIKTPGHQKSENLSPTASNNQTSENSVNSYQALNRIDSAEAEWAVTGKQTTNLADYLMNMDSRSSRQPALKHAMDLWQAKIEIKPYLNAIDDDQAFFRLSAKPGGLFIHRVETDMNLLKKLNLPAILEFYPPGSTTPGYLTLSNMDGNKIILRGKQENDVILTDLEELEFYWSGVAYLPWKNFHSIWGTIPVQSYKDSIITLKLLLQDIGFKEVEINDVYDGLTQEAVEKIQAKYGIPIDGFVGPLTKIILYKEIDSFEMPQIIKKDKTLHP